MGCPATRVKVTSERPAINLPNFPYGPVKPRVPKVADYELATNVCKADLELANTTIVKSKNWYTTKIQLPLSKPVKAKRT